MRLRVTGTHVISGKPIQVWVFCKESIFQCGKASFTTYLDQDFGGYVCYMADGSVKVALTEDKVPTEGVQSVELLDIIALDSEGNYLPNKDEIFPEDENNYFHVCWWDDTVAGYMDVTLDFHLTDVRITVFADDYDGEKIKQVSKLYEL